MGQVVSDLIPKEDWNYYPSTDIDPVLRDILATAKERGYNDCQHTIILIGFSWGGGQVVKLAEKLKKEGISVELVITLDPVPRTDYQVWPPALPFVDPKFTKSPNVTNWVNFYQKQSHPMGWSVKGADVDTQLTGQAKSPDIAVIEVPDPDNLDGPKRQLQALKQLKKGPLPWAQHASVPVHFDVLTQIRKSVETVPEAGYLQYPKEETR